jgi:predicted NUDIX family NTP pyrophosphohydrolase
MKQSAGILMYKVEDGRLKVLLVHPGGPLFARKDLGVWSIPKGEYEDGDDPAAAAVRELEEETGAVVAVDDLVPLGTVRQRGGKVVTAWCVPRDFDVATQRSNTFEMEWPPRSGVIREFPEVDAAAWFEAEEAKRKANPAQAELVDRLARLLAGDPGDPARRG